MASGCGNGGGGGGGGGGGESGGDEHLGSFNNKCFKVQQRAVSSADEKDAKTYHFA